MASGSLSRISMRLLGGGLTINNDDAAPTVDGGRDNYLLGSQFLGRLADLPHEEPDAFADNTKDFATYLLDERGLSFATVRNRLWHIERFLQSVRRRCGSITQIVISDIDAFLSQKGKEGWCRVSIATSAGAIRSFFRHAEMRGWCRLGIAAAIDAPRLFKHEGLPS